MILIADSGSTKTQWYLTDGIQKMALETIGYNPIILSTLEIQRSLESTFLPQISKYINKVRKIYFYGAGCASLDAQIKLKSCLSYFFLETVEISVNSDLWASVYATCGAKPGLCCILGTGSNACVFDGKKIIDQLPSLGYILGDEGSGGQIGKHLLRSFFYREMPEELASSFQKTYELKEHTFVKTLYAHLRPNQFLANFADFAVSNRTHPFIQEILSRCFDGFVKAHLLKFKEINYLPIHFVGSVAAGFRSELEKVLAQYQLKVGKILKTPFPDLLEYQLAENY